MVCTKVTARTRPQILDSLLGTSSLAQLVHVTAGDSVEDSVRLTEADPGSVPDPAKSTERTESVAFKSS